MALIFNGQFQGLANSKWSGVAGSFYRSVGIDGHSQPGSLTVHQKLTKESGATVTELCKVRVACSNGYSFWFSAESGKIWARKSDGTWSLAYTTTAGAGEVKCLGAIEYNGFIIWATESRVHIIAVADADDSWANVVLNWATFSITNKNYHPMAIQDLTCFIGDGNQVSSIDDTITATPGVGWNDNALDITDGLIIKTMTEFEIDLLIGTVTVATTVNRTQIIRWDCVSPSWNTSDPIEEVGINAFIRDDNYTYVNAGRAGNIYFYDGANLQPFKKLPGNFSNTQYGIINPGAVGNYQGRPIFGFSNGAGNPALQGVYTLGSYSKDYPKVLDLSWPISSGNMSAIEIGAVLVLDFDILVSWKDSTVPASITYGVDKIDYSNKYASAYFETVKLAQDQRETQKTLREIDAYYDSLPANTGFNFYTSKNGTAYDSALTSVTDVDAAKVYAENIGLGEIGSLQIKVAFIVHNNDAPVMEALGIEI
jgi:hypothetical protein